MACIVQSHKGHRIQLVRMVGGVKRKVYKHRIVYSEYHNIPLEQMEGLVIRHTCDNGLCMNVDHMLLGTQLENIQDCVDRERTARGERNAWSKLTEQDILDIRASTLSQTELSRVFGVGQDQISRIIHRKRWGHV